MIAEDNAQSLYLLETLLTSKGYTVVATCNGAEALASALDSPPDIIVTDILMPVMDGFELCRRWKSNELLHDVPFVFYTATYVDRKDEELALSLGADRFVVKPQQPEVLLGIIQEVLTSFSKSNAASTQKALADEKEVLLQYNEVLFHKLEAKILQLESEVEKQKRTSEALRESEKKYQNLIEQSRDGIFAVNLQGIFLSVNRVMCENLKYSEEELLSMSIWDIVPAQYVEQHKKRIADILVGRAPNGAAEYVVKGKDGETHYVEILSGPHYEDAKLIGFQGIARDITDRKQAEAKLEKSYLTLKKTLNDAINTMAKIVEMRDPYTSGHQLRVAQLATALAREMDLDESRIENVRMAAVIHDIGKIYVPSDILNKPGKLTRIEFDLIKDHARNGYIIVKNMDLPLPVAQAIQQHHERLDGSGYPDGLKGTDISMEARIMAVADVVEAMSSHRPYRPAPGIEKALAEISANSGILYDPVIVDTCIRLFQQNAFSFETEASA